MDLLLRVVVHSVGVVEPAVVGIPLLAVHDGIRGVVGLRQLVPVLDFDQVEVAAVSLTRVLLLSGAECAALDTFFVFSADSWTCGAGFASGTLKFRVSAFTGATFTCSSAVTDLLVTGHTCAIVQRTVTGAASPGVVTDANPALTSPMPPTQLVSRAVAVEVVTLAVLTAVPLLRVFSFLTLTCATHTFSIVAADVGAVVFAAGPVHVFCSHFMAAAFTESAHA